MGKAQLISGPFMDYALPRAEDVPFFQLIFTPFQPCAILSGLRAPVNQG